MMPIRVLKDSRILAGRQWIAAEGRFDQLDDSQLCHHPFMAT
jgi:hypothetical protein